MLVSDFIVERLLGLGVRHVFGVGGANIEDLFSAVQKRRPAIRAILGKHEHAAGTAADAYARITGLGVVLTTSGGGAMNVVHALAEARASHVPLLAIVGEPPMELQGRGAFQDTSGKGGALDARAVFDSVTSRCFRAESAAQVPGLLDAALDAALGDRQGPAVLLVAKDLQRAELGDVMNGGSDRHRAGLRVPSASEVELAANWLDTRPIVILAGSAVARESAQDALAAFAERVDALVATTPDGRDAFDNRHPRFIGVSGAMGHADVERALNDARLVVAVGTRLPLLARQGLEHLLSERRLLSIGHDAPFVAGREGLHLGGEIAMTLGAITAKLDGAGPAGAISRAAAPASTPRAALPSGERLSSATVLRAVELAVPQGGVVLVDAGNTGASAIHHVRAPQGGRWLVAMGMAGMGWAFGAATGAALATGKRCFVLAGDGAFFMHGMEIHTAVEHSLPITYVILNNRAHGMCLVRERLLLGENAGYNAFRASHVGAGLAAMFPGLLAADCTNQGELESLLAKASATDGPSVIAVELDELEVPPFAAFQKIAPGATAVAREVDHV